MILFLFVLILTAFVSCEENNSEEVNKCEGIICQEWERCTKITGKCKLKIGRCNLDSDCFESEICNDQHTCISKETSIYFITSWEIDVPESSESSSITIPINSIYSYDYSVDCNNDGVFEARHIKTGHICTYYSSGIYQIVISGNFPAIYFGNPYSPTDSEKIISVDNWGKNKWVSMEYAFSKCSNLTINAVDSPDLSNVTNMNGMFSEATSFNQDISNWDVSNVTSMIALFAKAKSFNQNINNWNVSNVITMNSMFSGAEAFNQDLNLWDVSNVTDMSNMFSGAASFNQSLNSWDVSKVVNMDWMFLDAVSFNENISGWNVVNVTSMNGMFKNAKVFNQNINSWNVSNVRFMKDMFNDALEFNQSLNNWNVSNVTTMNGMFAGAETFNQDINIWDVSNVNNMSWMFFEAIDFNQMLDNWNVQNVTDMGNMFYFALIFNQDLSLWDVDNVILCSSFKEGAALWTLPIPNFTACEQK